MESPQEDVRPCVQGCGFYGTSQTGYMCSKCFKDVAGATRASIESAPAPAPTPSPPALSSSTATTTTTTNATGPSVLPTLAREPSTGDSSASPSMASASVGVEPEAASAASSGAVEEEAKAMAVATEEDAAKQEGEGAATTAMAADTPPVQKKRNRCATCNKKVGLTGIECRCELIFCGLHRYPEAHNCSFDFKAHDRENLKKVLTGGGEFSKVERL